MADFYVDASKLSAGDYGGAWAGTATGTSGSTTLTINSNTSGVLTPGAFITGTGIAADTQIISGTGGPPFTSVVLSRPLTASPSGATMAANGCIVTGGTVPTKCEDGNGKGTGTATMATLVITFTGIPAAADTITIGGVTFTAVASGATGNQFNAVTDATTCATNLKNAINASTTNLVNPTPAIATAPLRNVVNATSSAGVVTVYTRTGGTEWNSVTETENLTNCTVTQWAGGGDGAWGWYFNAAAIGYPTSVAIATHGGIVGGSYLGAPQPGDVIHVRTARSGADIVLDVTSANSSTVLPRNMGSVTAFCEVRFDNGVIWSGDNGVFTIRKSGSSVASNTTIWALNNTTGSFIYWHGQMQSGTSVQSGGTLNWKICITGATQPYNIRFSTGNSGPGTTALTRVAVIEGLNLEDGWGTGHTGLYSAGGSTGISPVRFINCRFAFMTVADNPIFPENSSYGGHYECIDCLFAFASLTFTKVMFNLPTGSSFSVKLVRPKFTGGNGGQHILVPWAAAFSLQALLIIEDPVDIGQFIPTANSAGNCCGTVGGFSISPVPLNGEMSIGQFVSSNTGDRAFLVDTPRKLLEWRAASFPTTGLSVLPDNTPYSVRFSVTPSTFPGVVGPAFPQRGIRQVVVNSLGDNTLTLTQRFLLDADFGGSTYTPAAGEWWIEGTFVNTSGVTVPFSTRSTAPATDASGLWSGTTYSPFAGASRNFSAWKCTATLTNVEDATEVVCYLVCAKQPSAANQWCFIDPQHQLAV